MRGCRWSRRRRPERPYTARMRVLVWALRFVVFLALFALALNNQHEVTLHSFFGIAWHTRMIYVVLAAFVVGCAVGVLAMVPRWWRRRQAATPVPAAAAAPAVRAPAAAADTDHPLSQFGAEAALPPRRPD
jgi:lipopolysaccharide assembly protein A